MAITQPSNAGFEDAGASAGLAADWVTTATANGSGGFTANIYADFSGAGDPALSQESFNVGWSTSPYVGVVTGGTVAFFDTLIAFDPNTEEAFDFWDSNELYVSEVSGGVAATFGASLATADTFTDDGWGTGAAYRTTLAGGDLTAGIIDDLETGWSNDTYVTEVSGGTSAGFAKPTAGLMVAEGFEHVAPDLLFTVPLPVNDECVTAAAHGKSNGYLITVISTGVRPGGLVENVPYYFVSASGAIFKLSLSPGGAAVDLTDSGSGTHSIHAEETKYWTVPLGVTF